MAGRHAAAEPLLRRALAIEERCYESESAETMRFVNTVAMLMHGPSSDETRFVSQ